ncbi:hypothetical protein ACP275_01G056400 [Erythranthe tilingii]
MFRRSLLESTLRVGAYKLAPRVHGSGSSRPFDAFSQFPQNARAFSGLTKKSHFESSILGNLCVKLGLVRVAENASLPYALNLRSSIHSGTKAEFEAGSNSSIDVVQELLQDGINDGPRSYQPQVRGFTPRFRDYGQGYSQDRRNGNFSNYEAVESNADIVHIKLMRNNAFVTVTDSKGNKKIGVSAGKLAGKAGKLSRYAGEAAAEDIGRKVRQMKTKSVVVKVNGFTFFRRKKEAILSFKDGYTNSRGDTNPVVYVEDTTRKPHNGCRRPKKRRI